MMKIFDITFIDIKEDFAKSINKYFGKKYNNICTMTSPVEKYDTILNKNLNVYYVSPANSIGFMDGGIDYIYAFEMFPNLEETVQNKIETLGLKTNFDRYYLPIGSAILVNTQYKNKFIISAPTMFLPQNVNLTQNSYYAFYAILKLLSNANIPKNHKIVIPALCCGVGGMSCDRSAKQIARAYFDFYTNRVKIGTKFQNETVFISDLEIEEKNIGNDRSLEKLKKEFL